MRFKKFIEATDIFGFGVDKPEERDDEDLLNRPIHQFDIELMMELLSKKSLGADRPYSDYPNEIQWGSNPGAVKLWVDPGYTFYVKKMGIDKGGHPRWITKRMFQMNRTGYGGLEDAVAQEVYEHLQRVHNGPLDAPIDEYKDLENLVTHISNKIKRTAKSVFLYEGIKKLGDNNYLIVCSLRGHGLELPGHQRAEQNMTQVSYDSELGTIRVTNYCAESPVGGPHKWEITPSDLDVYFFPTQSREEIGECVSVHMKYY